ncbi:hypothetical protein [uncultured Anaerofustis sp.]|uniref:hypothetical protein n=1 Tax=uncultured Anaerofustis sp. TaxID=904996 RepID=UPI0025EACB55|nr:hypothetical protein [uncultured Anaerofustis sp.]
MSITAETRKESLNKVNKKILYMYIKDVLKKGDYTAREVAGILFKKGQVLLGGRQAVAPRLTELTKRGDVEVIGKKYDKLTHVHVAVYRLTSNTTEGNKNG